MILYSDLPSYHHRWIVFGLCAAAALCLGIQLLSPGFVGIANNGDFGKVSGYLALAPAELGTNFIFFQPDYVYAARNFWDSPYHSSETALAWIATRLAGATRDAARFDLRWLGAVHAAICLVAFAILLAAWRRLPPRALILSALAPLVIFTDVCYAAYCNSFYMDAAALCALLMMTATAIWLIETPGLAPLCAFTASAFCFVASKTQHSLWMWLPAAFLVAQAVRGPGLQFRVMASIGAAFVLVAGVAMLVTSDRAYRGQAMFNVLFFRLGPDRVDLRELGVAQAELAYVGMHSYTEGSPAANRIWTERFYQRTGALRLTRWYARHPSRAAGFMVQTLREGAPEMRPINLSNFPRSAGRPAGALSKHFAIWSDLRAALLQRWPWHLPLWYAVFLVGCALSRSRLKWLALGIAILGLGEFTAAALGDSLDAGRHLFLFHAATDITICFAAAQLAQTQATQAVEQALPPANLRVG